MLERKIYKKLENWKKNNKALLITGARQVGKTYIIREFLKSNFKNYIEFNLFNESLVREALDQALTIKEVLLRFSALTDIALIPHKTVIFID